LKTGKRSVDEDDETVEVEDDDDDEDSWLAEDTTVMRLMSTTWQTKGESGTS
jgi:hypothetical protein